MTRQTMISLALLMAALTTRGFPADEDLAGGFANPPEAAKPWVYWWWLDSNASKPGITRDLEEMKRQGIGGALVFDAGQGHTSPVGPKFMSDPWRQVGSARTCAEETRIQRVESEGAVVLLRCVAEAFDKRRQARHGPHGVETRVPPVRVPRAVCGSGLVHRPIPRLRPACLPGSNFAGRQDLPDRSAHHRRAADAADHHV